METEIIYDNICDRIEYYLDNNGINSSRYYFEMTNSSSYNIDASFVYTFKVRKDVNVVAGGQPAQYNYYYKDYIQEQNNFLQYANNPQEINTYLEQQLNNPLQSLSKQSSDIIWQSAQISYYYECNTCSGSGALTCQTCNGKGKNRCSSCFGTGDSNCTSCNGSGTKWSSETVHGYDGRSETRNVTTTCHSCGGSGKQSCYSCGGSGKRTCSRCGGSGETACNTCSGYGFFREYCVVYTDAEKCTMYYYPEKELYSYEITQLLIKNKNTFYVENFKPSINNHEWGEKGEYIFNYSGLAEVVEISITLDGKVYYNEVGVNNIRSIIYPNIFDYLLKPFEEMYEQHNKGITGFIKNKTPLKSYFHLKNYRALRKNVTMEAAFKAHSSYQDKELDLRAIHISQDITANTGNLISNSTSKKLGELAAKTMNSVAPYTTRIIWYLIYGLVGISEVYLTISVFKNVVFNGPTYGDTIYDILISGFLYLTFFYSITFGFIAPIGSILNTTITKFRQSAASKEHRPKINNRKHLRKLFQLNFLTFAATILGMFIYKVLEKNTIIAHQTAAYLATNNLTEEDKHIFNLSTLLKGHKTAIRDFFIKIKIDILQYFHNLPAWFSGVGVHITPEQYAFFMPFLIFIIPFLYLFFLPSIITIARGGRRKFFIFMMNLIITPVFFMIPWLYLLYISLE